jgi:NAD(P)-dependent dehydrogenase (short-subunit alcohol dehydrogenase family)
MNLKDKVVVITGASKGFGRALAEAFLDEGSRVTINSTNQKEIQEIAKEIGALGASGDVTNEEDLNNIANQTIKQFGTIDIWINNAGVWTPHAFAEDFDMHKVKMMFEVNVIGAINGSRVALRYMKEKGIGTIINIISYSGLVAMPKGSVYSASKWAVNGFTKGIREENKNLSILSVFPGGMKTDIFGENKPVSFNNFMDIKDVAQKMIENLKLEEPEEELVIQKV